MERFELRLGNQFFIDKLNKKKYIAYRYLWFNPKHKSYEISNKLDDLKLGIQICDFINTDFYNLESALQFVNKYNVSAIASLSDIKIYEYYPEQEYNEMVVNVINSLKDKLEDYKKAFINDITYIYNLNELEELNEFSPIQRLHILRDSKKTSEVKKLYDPNNLKLSLNNFNDFKQFSITDENEAQEIMRVLHKKTLNTFGFESKDIIQSFIIELFEMTSIENCAIKKCKNCGKYFVPDNRIDELYCSNIYENDKTCKEVGSFKTKQKLMQENDDLRIYRNVYQKLLLRTRRNPNNYQYEDDFIEFKQKNAELKDKVEKSELTQKEYMEWLEKQ